MHKFINFDVFEGLLHVLQPGVRQKAEDIEIHQRFNCVESPVRKEI